MALVSFDELWSSGGTFSSVVFWSLCDTSQLEHFFEMNRGDGLVSMHCGLSSVLLALLCRFKMDREDGQQRVAVVRNASRGREREGEDKSTKGQRSPRTQWWRLI